ncbi:Zn(II)2Cys6 transcription factor [Aspergillus undulatus]|uniref:Zn(II)2Cys6 transcription factor n=1 Tax=Aspergillus undulatus TaxID=1810928 RepID=UPI003CCD724B
MSQKGGSNDSVARPRRAHVEHGKRSKNGCATCVSKKVKCDETRPHCGRCVRLRLTCEWPLPRPSLRERRRGYGPIKSRHSGLWSPSSIVPRDAGVTPTLPSQSDDSLTPNSQRSLPSPGFEGLFEPENFLADGSNDHAFMPVDGFCPEVQPRDGNSSAETPASSMVQVSGNREHLLNDMLSVNAFELLRTPLMDPILTAADLSFAHALGPALGSDDRQAVLFHCKVFAPLKSTRDWSCSAHTLFLDKAYNRDMAFHFLLAVSHSELAIHYGQGPQPPQESRHHYERGSQLLLQAQNPFATIDHVSMTLSFLYMYMFWMRRDHFNPTKLKDLSRAVLSHVRTYGLDTLCASDDVLSLNGESACDGVITPSEQVLLARIITYLYDRDGFCSFFGCGGMFADYTNSISQKRQRIWLRSRAAFFLPLSDEYTNGSGSELEDAVVLDVYFELIILHQEINSYSQAPSTQAIGMKPKLQQRLEAIQKDQATLFQQVAEGHSKSTLMAYVAATFSYALQIYLYRARTSQFGTRPIPTELQHTLSSLVSTAYYATKTGQVQLLERFQWSLFMAGLEITDPIHQEWIAGHLSDPAIKKAFDHCQAVKEQSPGGITMHKIRSLVDEGFSIS